MRKGNVRHTLNRRDFVKGAGALLAGSVLPLSLIECSQSGAGPSEKFSFAYISDSHITHLKGAEFVRNWDRGLIRAVAELNLMSPQPDFVVYGGDIAQLGTREEIDHGLQLMAGVRPKVHYVMGEHDYYLDLGEYWEKQLGPHWYSFDHKGVHFIVLNSIITFDEWTHDRWPTPEARMDAMARLDNPEGSPFMVGEEQRKWLAEDLKKVGRKTPVVVFSHSPLQKIFRGWNFWTEDAEEVQALLKPFDKVTVFYGHVHQIQYNQIGNISFHAAMATAWPWPYPETYSQEPNYLPKLTVPMNRADPFFERDATGWQFINLETGDGDVHYALSDNTRRVVAFNEKAGRPEDTAYQGEGNRIPPQAHY